MKRLLPNKSILVVRLYRLLQKMVLISINITQLVEIF